jgi:hypothetical protein
VRNDPQLNSYVSHLPDNSVGFLNEVKKYFDQSAKNSGSKFNPGANQQVQAAHEKAASAIRQIAEIKSPDYGVALAIQQQARERFSAAAPRWPAREARQERRDDAEGDQRALSVQSAPELTQRNRHHSQRARCQEPRRCHAARARASRKQLE